MTETAISRLTREIVAVDGLPDLKVELTQADARALLATIEDLCPDHWACEECSDPYCDNCLPDTGPTCPHDRLLCLSCAVRVCRECADDVREDAAAEAYADSIGSRY